VNSNPDRKRPAVRCGHFGDFSQHFQSCSHQLFEVLRVFIRNSRRDHVAIADRLDLLEPISRDDAIKSSKEVIQKNHDVGRGHLCRQFGEPDNIGKQ